MKITITENEKAFANAAAWRIIGQILRKQRSVIGLSTGRTTENYTGLSPKSTRSILSMCPK